MPRLFRYFVAVQLLVVVVVDCRLEKLFVFGTHDRHGIAPEIRARHRHDMRRSEGNQPSHQFPQPVISIRRAVVVFVNAEKTVVQLLVADLLHGDTQCRMGANQNPVGVVGYELPEPFYLLLFVLRIAKIVVRRHFPVGEEAVFL